MFHTEAGVRTLVVGGPEADGFGQEWVRSRDEQRGEELRLLYVAMTRARHQLVIWWAATANAKDSPLGRLLFSRDAEGGIPAVGGCAPDRRGGDADPGCSSPGQPTARSPSSARPGRPAATGRHVAGTPHALSVSSARALPGHRLATGVLQRGHRSRACAHPSGRRTRTSPPTMSRRPRARAAVRFAPCAGLRRPGARPGRHAGGRAGRDADPRGPRGGRLRRGRPRRRAAAADRHARPRAIGWTSGIRERSRPRWPPRWRPRSAGRSAGLRWPASRAPGVSTRWRSNCRCAGATFRAAIVEVGALAAVLRAHLAPDDPVRAYADRLALAPFAATKLRGILDRVRRSRRPRSRTRPAAALP